MSHNEKKCYLNQILPKVNQLTCDYIDSPYPLTPPSIEPVS